MAKPNCAPETAANLAGRILLAWKSGHGVILAQELDYVASRTSQTRDTLELERMDLLEGVAQSLRHGHQEQVRAAVQLLEHLAGSGPGEFSW